MPTDAAPLWSFEYLMGRWHPTIGDPSFIGWFTVGAYFAGAVLTFWAARAHPENDRRSFYFWVLVSLLMVLLGINKQLDLQTLLTEIGRQVARYQGWMEQRRTVQFWFIVFFSILAAVGFLEFVYFMRNCFRRFMLAFIGLFFLLTFIIIRAASFHHFDEVLRFSILDFEMNWIFELTGIFTIIAAAVAGIRRSSNARRAQGFPKDSDRP
jgi:hypothetical protein